ncbi:hypothetical protein [Methylorubrum extorquens]|uniref:hypothetical protein n=1 Tax=Methylorubrum extorquens TaxID=408 RepID=UPI00209F747F|nr:hypothetical protein [Methylorubrum extorquens]MCP1540001.1 hypothetical protein [Methylorubrum extorquens]
MTAPLASISSAKPLWTDLTDTYDGWDNTGSNEFAKCPVVEFRLEGGKTLVAAYADGRVWVSISGFVALMRPENIAPVSGASDVRKYMTLAGTPLSEVKVRRDARNAKGTSFVDAAQARAIFDRLFLRVKEGKGAAKLLLAEIVLAVEQFRLANGVKTTAPFEELKASAPAPAAAPVYRLISERDLERTRQRLEERHAEQMKEIAALRAENGMLLTAVTDLLKEFRASQEERRRLVGAL